MVHLTTEQAAPLNGQSSAQDASPVAQSRMDQTLKAEFVSALRSGKYEQGQRALRRENTFCCLGVLCDLMGAEWEDGDGIDLGAEVNGEHQNYYLGPIVLKTAGLADWQQEHLYHMNDDGKSFAEIADYIEQNL